VIEKKEERKDKKKSFLKNSIYVFGKSFIENQPNFLRRTNHVT
jgi:hypothetical protein